MKLNDIAAICKQYNIRNYKINSDGTIDVTGNVNLSKNEFSTLPLKFGKVTGHFYCYDCPNLTSLERAPSEVSGNFICHNCPKLTSLKGAPSEISGDFYCGSCPNLTSLVGAPVKIGGNFSCSSCPNLTSLVGAPSEVGVDFSCYGCSNLTSLNGAPGEVGGDFHCGNCLNLTSLEGTPDEIGGNFYCVFCPNLTKLSHLNSINGKLNINNTPITNLLAIFNIENLKEIAYEKAEIANIINKHLKNPDRDAGMIECRQELRNAGFSEYMRIK